jgi:hypothetical protein
MSNLFALNLVLVYSLLGVLALIVLNVALAIVVSLIQGTFNLQQLPQYLTTEIPYFLALLALVVIAQVNFTLFASNLGMASGWATGLAVASMSAYALKMVEEISQKVLALFGVTVNLSASTAGQKRRATGYIHASAFVVLTLIMMFLVHLL